MPRRPKPEDIDFEIHVDPSCLSATTEEDYDDFAMDGRASLPGEESTSSQTIEELESQIREQLDQVLDSESSTPKPEIVQNGSNESPATEPKAVTIEDVTDVEEVGPTATEDDSILSNHQEDEDSLLSTGDHETSLLSREDEVVDNQQGEDESAELVMQSIEGDSLVDGEKSHINDDFLLQDQHSDHVQTPDANSRRESELSATSATCSPRRGSGRTEALIQAAARNIVAQIEQGQEVDENDTSFVSETETVERSRTSDAYTMDAESRRSSAGEVDEPEQTRSADESSSHHENEDDVFSDHSPRSSVGSASEAAQSDGETRKMDDNVTRRSTTRSPRMSGLSYVSGFSQYDHDEDDFIPTVRGTPRPAFRSPSSVKAMQMSSPPASVFGSPRSSRRTPLPTVSRLGSPGISAQYSPKKTPPRFKRNSPPLVLLHVTLLPLRWPWGDVLDDADDDELSPDGKNLRDAWRQLQDRMGDTTCERGILLPHPQNDYEVLEERLLEALELPLRRRARILECGHYLGPANEMDMLEDLESDEEDYDDEDPNIVLHSPGTGGTHWCSTCRSDIRYDSLGAGKVFRVKVYASNGLMKAGAWDTCWKEMERVDVEIEPLVGLSVQHELSRLQTEQERRQDEEHAIELGRSMPQEDDEYLQPETEEDLGIGAEPEFLEEPVEQEPESQEAVPAQGSDSARRLRVEARLREIYGHTPPATHPSPSLHHFPSPAFTAHASPPSPSVEAFERRQQRTRAVAPTASLPELLLESARVLMQDRKNVVILVMGLLVAMLAMRGGENGGGMGTEAEIERLMERREVPTLNTILQETTARVVEEVAQASVEPADGVPPAPAVMDERSSEDGSASGSIVDASVSVQREVVRIVETITETAVETATVTQTFTAVETEAVEAEADAQDPIDDESAFEARDARVDAEVESPEPEASVIPAQASVSDDEAQGTEASSREDNLTQPNEPVFQSEADREL